MNHDADHDAYVENARRRVRNTPAPAGQKFMPGTRVRIADDLGPGMRHFPSGVTATVLHTYAHAYQCDNVLGLTRYCLDVDGHGWTAWYNEDQLTALS